MRFALAVLALLGLPLAAACHENGCDQPPFYACGTYYGETRHFCYWLQDGRFVPALEPDVVNITAPPWSATPLESPPGLREQFVAYLWLAPLKALVAEPFTAPIPRFLYQETNDVAGLQASSFHCADFVWFNWPEYPPGCWMGPFHRILKAPDTRVLL